MLKLMAFIKFKLSQVWVTNYFQKNKFCTLKSKINQNEKIIIIFCFNNPWLFWG